MSVGARGRLGATAVLAVLLLGGCASGGGVGGEVQDVAQRRMAQGMADAFQPSLTVNPPDGAAGVSPGERVTALVASGRLTQVELRSEGGNKIDGALSPDGERWISTAPLKPDTSYVLTTAVRATSGKESSSTSKFSTLSPGQQVGGKITPEDGATLASDRAVSVVFDKPIGDRAAAERALNVSSDPPVSGTAEWRGDRELVWRPSGGWPAGGRVTASMAMFGKQLGKDQFGARDLRAAYRGAGGDPARAEGDVRANTPRRDDTGLVSNSVPRAAPATPTPRATPPRPQRQAPAPAARSTPRSTPRPSQEPNAEESRPTSTKKKSSPGLPILG